MKLLKSQLFQLSCKKYSEYVCNVLSEDPSGAIHDENTNLFQIKYLICYLNISNSELILKVSKILKGLLIIIFPAVPAIPKSSPIPVP